MSLLRLLIVSNRLPVTVSDDDGRLVARPSAGGLVSGLGAYLRRRAHDHKEHVWIGWPGIDVPPAHRDPLRAKLADEHRAVPVFVSQPEMDGFYNGFCNSTLWPLFHYFPSYAAFDDAHWDSYCRMNERFCDAVMEQAQPDDVIWVHDYHLMLLPRLLRERGSNHPIGFFLHIPFPSFELFRLLPARWRGQLLEGLLGSDLVGFHTHDYTQHFLRCIQRILGRDHTLGQIAAGDRLVQCDTFPMGIDYERYHSAACGSEVRDQAAALRASFGDRTLIVSVDRLDYSKGVITRLHGFERFLERSPEWRGRVVLMLVLVPSRTEVERYSDMKRRIDELVGSINGKFATPEWMPIFYQYRSLAFPELIARYSAGDVALVTPLRDGMNLVAKEYLASRTDDTGVLILSEMAGASRELGEAITITPTTSDEIADALTAAVNMPKVEQAKRIHVSQARLQQYDVVRWAEDFMHQLGRARAAQARFHARVLKDGTRATLVEQFRDARRRILLLDYDGTLVPFAARPDAARPSEGLLAVLERLAHDPRDRVVVISGRPRATLDEWLRPSGVSLVAEHGAWVCRRGDDAWQMTKPLRNDWKRRVLPLLHESAARLPGAFVEEKEYALVWHYRNADLELASTREKELVDSLRNLTANLDLTVVQGHRIVEVRNAGISKGTAALEFLDAEEFDFVLAIGDDTTDEDLFSALPQSAYSIRVGMTGSHARFNLADHADVLRLLHDLASSLEVAGSSR